MAPGLGYLKVFCWHFVRRNIGFNGLCGILLKPVLEFPELLRILLGQIVFLVRVICDIEKLKDFFINGTTIVGFDTAIVKQLPVTTAKLFR